MNKKLYVGNLPFEMTDSKLEEMFSGAGKVESASVVRDRATGQARGFAFVEMEDGADEAISSMNGAEFQGRTLTVNEARPREDRPRSGGDRQRSGSSGRRW